MEILRLEICFAILIPRPEKEQKPCSADGSFISGFPILDGVSTRVFVLTSRATFQQLPKGLGSCHARGEHIHQAAKEGNVGAVRHFLHVDPESLEREGEDRFRRSLGAEIGNFGEDE